MSLKSIVITCDWPGCKAEQGMPGGACLRDYYWAKAKPWDGDYFPLPAEHRHKTEQEYEAELDRALE